MANNIYNSNSGNVGIGTTGPDAKLEIVQDTGLGSSGKPTLIVANDPNGATGYTFQSWRYVESNTNFRLDLKQRVLSGIVKYSFNMVNNGTGFDNVLVLDRGNVGIGTDSPSATSGFKPNYINGYATLATSRRQTYINEVQLILGMENVGRDGLVLETNFASVTQLLVSYKDTIEWLQ